MGLKAGRTPKIVPAATWNCPVLTHISFNRLTLVFILLPPPGRFIPGLIRIQKIYISADSLLLEAMYYRTLQDFHCYSSLCFNSEHLILFFPPLKSFFCKPTACGTFCGLIRAIVKRTNYLFWNYTYIIKFFAKSKIYLSLTGEAFPKLYIADPYLSPIFFHTSSF